MNSTIARILCSGSGMALTRASRSAGNSEVWTGRADAVSRSSMGLAFSNAASKLRSVSNLLRCAISAIATSSGSREGDARGGVLSIPWRAVDRIFPQSHRIPRMSRHTDSSYRLNISASWTVPGHISLDLTVRMGECVGHADILVCFAQLRTAANVMTLWTKRLERHNYVTSVSA